MYVKRVFIKNDKTGEEYEYKAKDADTLYLHRGYFTDVWSPDLEYLLMPVGHFEGVVVYEANNLFLSLRKQQNFQRINIRGESPSALAHNFKKWESNNTVVFEVGISYSYHTVKYDIGNRLFITKNKYLKNLNQ